jgi:hypothetical protein
LFEQDSSTPNFSSIDSIIYYRHYDNHKEVNIVDAEYIRLDFADKLLDAAAVGPNPYLHKNMAYNFPYNSFHIDIGCDYFSCLSCNIDKEMNHTHFYSMSQ